VRANLYDVDFVSPDDGWVVGEDSLILHWNGEDWKVSKPVIIDPGDAIPMIYIVWRLLIPTTAGLRVAPVPKAASIFWFITEMELRGRK
jgi:hypothetical protein